MRWIGLLDALRRRTNLSRESPTSSEMPSISTLMVAVNGKTARNAAVKPPVAMAKAATAARNGPVHPTPTTTYAAP